MATLDFPYGEFKNRFYPTIFFHIKSKNGKEKDLTALIDSGASVSTFRAEVAESLGIKLTEGEKRTSVGISGKVDVFIHEVEIRIFENWFPCKIAFSEQVTTSFNLLGREDFFNRHLVTFDEKKKKTILVEF